MALNTETTNSNGHPAVLAPFFNGRRAASVGLDNRLKSRCNLRMGSVKGRRDSKGKAPGSLVGPRKPRCQADLDGAQREDRVPAGIFLVSFAWNNPMNMRLNVAASPLSCGRKHGSLFGK
jgi:hypothetical protein